jgi:hypothetical protein
MNLADTTLPLPKKKTPPHFSLFYEEQIIKSRRLIICNKHSSRAPKIWKKKKPSNGLREVQTLAAMRMELGPSP